MAPTPTTAGTVHLEKRFRNGNSIWSQYTRSRARDQLNYLEPDGGQLEDRISPNDRPNRLTVGAVLHLPFGQGPEMGTAAGAEWPRPCWADGR